MWIIELSQDGHNEYVGPYEPGRYAEGSRDLERLCTRRDQLGKQDVKIALRRVEPLDGLGATLNMELFR